MDRKDVAIGTWVLITAAAAIYVAVRMAAGTAGGTDGAGDGELPRPSHREIALVENSGATTPAAASTASEVNTDDESNTPAMKPEFSEERVIGFAADYAARLATAGGSLGIDEIAALCTRHFGTTAFSLSDAIDILTDMMTSDDETARIAALGALSALHCELGDGSTPQIGDPDDTADADTADAGEGGVREVAPDDEQVFSIKLVSLGLADLSPAVRSAAYQVITSLPSEERSLLSLQLLGSDDAFLRESLVTATRDASDVDSLTLNFHALEDEDASIRKLAAENILSKTGQEFTTTAEAFEWLETQPQTSPELQPVYQSEQ